MSKSLTPLLTKLSINARGRLAILQNRLNRTWRIAKERAIPLVRAWLPRQWDNIALPLAWSLGTWAAWLFNPRAWAASVAVYILMTIVVRLVSEYYNSKRERTLQRKDQG